MDGQPEHQSTNLQNTNVINRADDVERVSMRPGGVILRGGAVFSSLARGASSSIELQASPVTKIRRISGGLGLKMPQN
ncbi:hypothetical protein ACHQM5_013052 [Ranunculus cassubicifolius]